MAEKQPMDSRDDRLKALQSALSKIEKDFGKGSIMKLGEQAVEPVEVIPTGSIGLDAALGVGGFPRGRIIEIFGPESSGKTTLAIHAMAEAQKAGGIAASSTPSTPSTPSMPRSWVWTPTTSSCRSPTTASRRWPSRSS